MKIHVNPDGTEVQVPDDTQLIRDPDSSITIGPEVEIGENVVIEATEGSKVVIFEWVKIKNKRIVATKNSKVHLRNDVEVEGGNDIWVEDNSSAIFQGNVKARGDFYVQGNVYLLVSGDVQMAASSKVEITGVNNELPIFVGIGEEVRFIENGKLAIDKYMLSERTGFRFDITGDTIITPDFDSQAAINEYTERRGIEREKVEALEDAAWRSEGLERNEVDEIRRSWDKQRKEDEELGKILWLKDGKYSDLARQIRKITPQGWKNWQEIRVAMELHGAEKFNEHGEITQKTLRENKDQKEHNVKRLFEALEIVNEEEQNILETGAVSSKKMENKYCFACVVIGHVLEWDDQGRIWEYPHLVSLIKNIVQRRESARNLEEETNLRGGEYKVLGYILSDMVQVFDEDAERRIENELEYWEKLKKDVFLAEAKQATIKREETLPNEVKMARVLYEEWFGSRGDDRECTQEDYQRFRELYPEICQGVEQRYAEFRSLVSEWCQAKDSEKPYARRKILRFDAQYPWVQNEDKKINPNYSRAGRT